MFRCNYHSQFKPRDRRTQQEVMSTPAFDAVEVNDLWFSYEVAENTGTTAKTIDKSLRDGGLSVDQPRKQHDVGTELVYKLQLSAIDMKLPVGARCLLIGSNGAGKSTLMNVIGGKHMVEPGTVKVQLSTTLYPLPAPRSPPAATHYPTSDAHCPGAGTRGVSRHDADV